MSFHWHPSGPEVDALATRAQAGDHEAMAELVERYRPLLRANARQIFWEDDVTCAEEDALQEATAVFIRSVLSEYRPERGAFGPFIKRLLNWRLSRLHRRGMHSVFARPLDEDLVRVLEHEGRLATWDPGDVEELRDLHAAFHRLSRVEQAVLTLIYWHDRPTAEVATTLGMTRRGVNQARKRAEERLKQALEERRPVELRSRTKGPAGAGAARHPARADQGPPRERPASLTVAWAESLRRRAAASNRRVAGPAKSATGELRFRTSPAHDTKGSAEGAA